MHRLNFIHIMYFIGTAVALSLSALTPCIAQEEASTLSGVVLDPEGKPIAGFTINLSPVFHMSKTDENGAFTFTDVPAGPVQIMIPPQQFGENEKPSFNPEPDHELVSIKIGGMTLYQGRHPPFGGINFAVKLGSHLKNIEVTVRPRMRIRARVVFKDRKPLTNASIAIVITSDGTWRSGATTDSEGYFVHYTDNNGDPAPYTVSVKYKGLSAKSEQFELEAGGRHDDLVLTLDGAAPPAAAPTQSKSSKASLPNLLRKLTGGATPPDKPASTETNPPAPTIQEPRRGEVGQGKVKTRGTSTTPRTQQKRPLSEQNTWAVNPANGHAYKKIRCGSLKDAKNRATAEGAYLVAINDEAEQKWLLGLFGNHLYWIGLSDAEKEGEWVWQNGEPVTYTNWGPTHSFPRSSLSLDQKDNAVMTFLNGQWHAVGPGDLLWRTTRYAILEKADVFNSSPAEQK
ncbi:carboxypeptidase regulatory-like domain-containing protein [Candidatus Poribacteria bacterium]|nr:carboxypeptidase regulatory-like domain-containing protein [Candidatus Poribacteria bacterium]